MEQEPTTHFEIRKATLADVPEVRRVQRDSWLATYPSEENGVPYETIAAYVQDWLTPEALEVSKEIIGERIANPNKFYRLAVRGEAILGFVCAVIHDDGTKELEAIYTDPTTFGAGVGQGLMNEALAWIGDADATLEVISYNQRAIRFYEKNGFKKVEGSEHMYKEIMPVIVMKREGVKS